MDNGWVDIGEAKRFIRDGHSCVTAEGIPVVVMCVDDHFYALVNRCPHAGLPLGDGERAGMTLTCPYHGYTYHIKTGKNIDFPDNERSARPLPVRVVADRLQVMLDHEVIQEA